MPSKTFLNLSTEKKKVIIKAAKREFARAILPEVKVSRIVEDAKISRGSFYDYFADLEDLFNYLIDLVYLRNIYHFSRFLTEAEQNYFIATKKHFDHLLKVFSREENRQFHLNIFASQALLNVEKGKKQPFFALISADEILKEIDQEVISKNLIDIIETIEIIKWVYIYQFLSDNLSSEQSLSKYSKYVDMMEDYINNTNNEKEVKL